MIKYIFLLFLISCSANTEQEYPEPTTEVKEPNRSQDASVKDKMDCKLFDVVKVRECKLYYFVCEDFSIEMRLICPVTPVGVITNPPRPIFYK
tara:strand:- start:442 stop:720 length:279 start_codon:yes stop_codon:yes gene_type:complete